MLFPSIVLGCVVAGLWGEPEPVMAKPVSVNAPFHSRKGLGVCHLQRSFYDQQTLLKEYLTQDRTFPITIFNALSYSHIGITLSLPIVICGLKLSGGH